MFFRSRYIVRHFGLRETPDTLKLERTNPPPVWLSLRKIREDEIRPFYESSDWVAELRTDEAVSPKVQAQFASPGEGEPTPAVREAAHRAGARMTAFLRDFLRIVQWRTGVYGHHEPIRCAEGDLQWSADQVAWTPVWLGLKAVTSSELLAVMYTETLFREVSELVIAEDCEPIGHELLREAWNLKRSSPRSALILAIAALEVGVKDFIARLVPPARWLCFEAPSPPTLKMLEAYLPTLPTTLSINGKAFIPEEILGTLKKAVHRRNEVAHTGKSVDYSESLDDAMNCIQMTLYFLDYYAGHGWALNNMRSHSICELLRGELERAKAEVHD
jgi:hypothetical protein